MIVELLDCLFVYLLSRLTDNCFEWMISPKFPIAVQALFMKMLYRICQIEPDFKPEIIAILEDINYQDYSSGFNSTRNSILKVLKNN